VQALRERIRDQLRDTSIKGAAALAVEAPRGLGTLITLTNDPDAAIGWRAVVALGQAAQCVAKGDPEPVRRQLRRLHWMLNDESGSVGWRAPQAMAEIVRLEPQHFAEYVPITIHLIRTVHGEPAVRAGILWAIGRLNSAAPAEVECIRPEVEACLGDPSPEVRGMAVWCVGKTGHVEAVRTCAALLHDPESVEIFEGEELRRYRIGELARRVAE